MARLGRVWLLLSFASFPVGHSDNGYSKGLGFEITSRKGDNRFDKDCMPDVSTYPKSTAFPKMAAGRYEGTGRKVGRPFRALLLHSTPLRLHFPIWGTHSPQKSSKTNPEMGTLDGRRGGEICFGLSQRRRHQRSSLVQ